MAISAHNLTNADFEKLLGCYVYITMGVHPLEGHVIMVQEKWILLSGWSLLARDHINYVSLTEREIPPGFKDTIAYRQSKEPVSIPMNLQDLFK